MMMMSVRHLAVRRLAGIRPIAMMRGLVIVVVMHRIDRKTAKTIVRMRDH